MPILSWALLVSTLMPMAEDWPRFRGPNGTGVSATTGLPVEFGPAKNMLWKTAVPFARSSPVLAGGRVFLTANEGEKLITLSLDARTGKIQWRREIVRERTHKIYRLNDPASPTPASDGTNVYVFFPDLGLVSYGPDGNERWRHPLGPFQNFYGMAGSPVVAGDLVLLICDQQAKSFFLAVDKNSGKARWRAERPEMTFSYSTPALYTPREGGPQAVVTGVDRVDGYNVDRGERQWWVRKTGGSIYGVPVVDQNSVYLHGEGADVPMAPPFREALQKYDTDKNGVISQEEFKAFGEFAEHFGAFDTDGNGSITEPEWSFFATYGLNDYGVQAINLGGRGDLTGTAHRWRFKKNLPQVPTPVVYQGVLYMVKDGGIITTLDPATGKVHKEGRTKDALGAYFSSPVAADGKVFLANEEGKVSVLKAGADWEVLAVNDLGEEIHATPAIADGKIYIRTRGSLFCFARR